MTSVGPLSMDAYLPGLPALTRQLGASASAGQLTITACMLGMAIGQLVCGPASDAFGRRAPLLAGIVGYVIASCACAAAPSVSALITLRLIQGFAAGAGLVVARAIVRDRFSDTAAAQMFATLVIITGAAPILGPLLGGQALRFTDWRGIFVGLAGLGVLLLLWVARRLPETLGAGERSGGGLAGTLEPLRGLVTDRSFTVPAAAFSLSFGAMFAYISGSSFVFENVYHASPQTFSIVFACNSAGLAAVSRLGSHALGRLHARALFRIGLAGVALASVATLAIIVAHAGFVVVVGVLFVVMAANGLVLSNGMATAMEGHGEVLGSASALLGMAQFGVGAALAPLVGLSGSHSAIPMAIVMAACGSGALLVELVGARRRAVLSC